MLANDPRRLKDTATWQVGCLASRPVTVSSSVQGSHGHEISGKVLKLENTISSTGNVLE